MASPKPPALSIIIPVLNEEESLLVLHQGIVRNLEKIGIRYEIIFVDDGSSDGSWKIISDLATEKSEVRGIRLRRNCGKAKALSVGVQVSEADILMTMDADLQDDPDEIPNFLKKLEEGYDLVSGWKKNRLDPLGKTLPSKLFNFVTSKVSGLKLKDFNCGFKAARREIYLGIPLYGELHRFIPVLAHAQGYRIGELAVLHHPRKHGVSKYGFERFVRGFLDLLTVLMMTRYAKRPAHFFGGVGVLLGVVGFLIILGLIGNSLFFGETFRMRPLLELGLISIVISVQFIFFGLIAELLSIKARLNSPTT